MLRVLAMVCIVLIGMISLTAQDAPQIDSPQRFITDPLDALALNADGTRLATGDRDGLVRVWDAASGATAAILTGHMDWVTQVAWSPDGTRIVSGGRDHTVRLWDVQQAALIATFTHHTDSVTGVAFSPDGRMIASGSRDGTVWIGEVATGNTIADLTNYSGPAWTVAFDPTGTRLASGSEDGTIWIWGLEASSLAALRGHSSPVTALDFDPTGAWLASSSWDGTVRLWDLATESTLMTLNGHAGPVTDVHFHTEGTSLLTTGYDGLVHLWDTARGDVLATLTGAQSPLVSLSLGVDGAVFAAGLDGEIVSWAGAQYADVLAVPAPPLIAQIPTAHPFDLPTAQPLTPNRATTPSASSDRATPAVEITPPPAPENGAALSLPTVNIYSPLTTFPLDGVSWAIDPWDPLVGHMQGTGWVNAPGNIALGGHSEYPDGTPGVFAGLYGLAVGDPVFLLVNGEQRRYTVTQVRSVNFDDLTVLYPTSHAQLTLITCDIPTYDPAAGQYWERLVIIAQPE